MIASTEEAAAIAAALGALLYADLSARTAGQRDVMMWSRVEHPRSWSEVARIEALGLDPDVV